MRQIEPAITEDNVLLQQIKEGSKDAFNILFEKYWGKAYADTYKRLKNHEDAKDIIQEIFTHIWMSREKVHIENFPGYLHIAIRNRVIKLMSKQKLAHPFFYVLDVITEKNYEADANLLWKEFVHSYEALLEALPPKRQTIFRLRYHEQKSTKDISTQLGITRKTVQNQLAKAIDSLKVSLSHNTTILLMLTIATA